MKRIVASVFALLSLSVDAEIYKWVDEEGITNFSERIPNHVDAEPVELKVSPSSNGLSREAQNFAESLASEILKDNGNAKTMDCQQAVFNAKNGIDTMLDVGKRSLRGGYIKEAEYRKVSAGLRKVRSRVSVLECKRSSGKVKGFYLCMSNDYNHIATCGKKYDYNP